MMKPKFFFACGTAAPLIYLGALLLGGAAYPGYKPLFQAVSELIAAGAPTKPALDVLFFFCGVMIALFGFGIQLMASRTARRDARLAARLGWLTLTGISLLSLLLLAFPMDPPGSASSFSEYTSGGLIHVALASLMSAASLPAVLLVGFWLSRQPEYRQLARYSFITGALLFIIGGITAVVYFSGHFLLGVFERLTFMLFFQWLLVTAWYLYKSEALVPWDENSEVSARAESCKMRSA